MLGQEKALKLLHDAVEYSGANQTQATLRIGESSLTRFANSIIHQNVFEKDVSIAIKAVMGRKVGYASTNRMDEQSIRDLVDKAVMYAKYSQENRDFVSLAAPKPVKHIETCDARTASYSPEDRASAVGDMIEEGARFDASASGTFSTGYEESAVVSSLGVSAYDAVSLGRITTVMTAGNGHGYADQMSEKVSDLEPLVVAAEAASRSERSRDPEWIEPGEYTVILLPYAVAEFMEFLAYLGLGALAYQEGRSFMSGKLGSRITGENITIWDDGLDMSGLPKAFDPEGVPKQRVDLIVNGVANAVVYDSYTAHKEGKESTGHATGGTGTFGPMPTNLLMKPGDCSIEELITNTDKGVLVTRFHYVNVIHPTQTIVTGMTRDGTFLIEGGRITKPVKNLRFTDSILERFSNVEAISRETMRKDIGVFPAIKAHGFRFTGTTEF